MNPVVRNMKHCDIVLSVDRNYNRKKLIKEENIMNIRNKNAIK